MQLPRRRIQAPVGYTPIPKLRRRRRAPVLSREQIILGVAKSNANKSLEPMVQPVGKSHRQDFTTRKKLEFEPVVRNRGSQIKPQRRWDMASTASDRAHRARYTAAVELEFMRICVYVLIHHMLMSASSRLVFLFLPEPSFPLLPDDSRLLFSLQTIGAQSSEQLFDVRTGR